MIKHSKKQKRNILFYLFFILPAVAVLLLIYHYKLPEGSYEPLWAIKPQYSRAKDFSCGVGAVYTEENQWSFVDTDGQTLWSNTYADVADFISESPGFMNGVARVVPSEVEAGLFQYRFYSKYLYRNGHYIDQDYNDIKTYNYFMNGLSLAKNHDGKYGLINRQVLWLLPPVYDSVVNLQNGCFLAENRDQLIWIDEEGTIRDIENISYRSSVVGISASGPILIKNPDDSFSFQDHDQALVFGPCEEARYFSDNLAMVKIDGKVGYIDVNGEYQIPPQYAEGGDFSEGAALVKTVQGESLFIDKSGATLFSIGEGQSSGTFQEGLVDCSLSEKEGFGLVDREGNWVLKPDSKCASIRYLGDGVFALYGLGRIGHYYKDSNVLIPMKYTTITPITEGRSIVSRSGKTGLVDTTTGELVIPLQKLEYFGYGEGLLCIWYDDHKFGYMDLNGNWVLSPQFEFASIFKNGVAHIEKNGAEGYIYNPLLFSQALDNKYQAAEVIGLVAPDRDGSKPTVSELLDTLQRIQTKLAEYSISSVVSLDSVLNAFRPAGTAPLTRRSTSQIAYKMAQCYGLETKNLLSFFHDVPPEDEDYDEISVAFAMGLFDNITTDTFSPDAELTDQEFCLLVTRLFEYLLDQDAFLNR